MGYERNDNAGSQGEYFGAREPWDTDHLGHRQTNGNYSSAADYAAAGQYGSGGQQGDRGGYGRDSYGGGRGGSGRDDYGHNDRGQSQNGPGQGDYGRGEYGNSRYGQREQQNAGRSFQNRSGGSSQPYYGSYAHDGHRFADEGSNDRNDRGGYYRPERNYGASQQQNRGSQGYGRQPQGYDYDDRGFFARAGDEVRSWFGDDEAERRRDMDARYDERQYDQSGYGQSGSGHSGRANHDDDYHHWRKGQIDALDRDYHEYRQENRDRFSNEFSTFRSERQTQRGSLSKVAEHMEVVGSDGEHIGTVDKVRGDRILLTKNDTDAGGRHHSIPSRWIDSVDDKVKVRKTAEEAKSHWRDEENNQAFFGDNQRAGQTGQQSGDQNRQQSGEASDDKSGGAHILNRSFSGTY